MQDQDMKFLVRGFVRWLLRIGLALNLILWLAVLTIYCQEKPQLHLSEHKERMEQEDESGWMFITVTEKVGDLVYFYREGRFQTKITSMGWDKNSVLQDKTKAPFKGCYLALFCRKHLYLYVIQRQPCVDNPGPMIFQ